MGHNDTKPWPPNKNNRRLSLLRKQFSYHWQVKHVAKVASQAGDVAGFGSGACSVAHLDPLLHRKKFKTCKRSTTFRLSATCDPGRITLRWTDLVNLICAHRV